MVRRTRNGLLAAGLLLLMAGHHAYSQAPPSGGAAANQTTPGGDVLFRAQVDRVVLYAAVFDSSQHLVTGLPQDAFKVYQDGKLQKISGFSNQDIPVSMGIAVDSSASM